MRNRSRLVLALGALITAPLAASAGQPGATVRVEVTGLRSSEGVVRACMTPLPRRFPRCQGDADARALSAPAAGRVVLDFGAVPAGRYAIALLHDENGNGKADRALSMIPREGFGFSRDAPVRMGPPSFEQAAFTVADTPLRLAVRMRYML